MYESAFGFTQPPFQDASQRFYFSTPAAHVAELKLTHLMERDLGLGLLVGPSGCGKTTLLRRLTETAESAGHAVVDFYWPRMCREKMLAFLNSELAGAIDPREAADAPRDEPARWLKKQLSQVSASGKQSLIVVDNVHLHADDEFFETLILLLNLRRPPQIRLNIILSGDLQLGQTLQAHPTLSDRVAVTAAARPFTMKETADYVSFRISMAAGPAGLFEEEALVKLFDLSLGHPRAINRLCDMALLVASVERAERVSAEMLDDVATECLPLAA